MMNDIFNSYLDRIERIINSNLSINFSEDWVKNSFGDYTPSLKAEYIKGLVYPTANLVSLGGKRWRPLLLVLTAEAELIKQGLSLEQSQDIVNKAYSITPLVEFVHNASLIHDDIEDCSDTRRGKPAAYITYGMDTAINAGSWLYFEAPIVINSLDVDDKTRCRLYELYTMELRRLHLGQSMDIMWHRDNTSFVTEEEYLTMVKSKTGTLSSFASKAGAMIAGANDKEVSLYGTIASEIGAGFQIIDDVINLTIGNPGKKRGDDIVEGKLSLPVILYKTKYGKESPKVKALEECFSFAHQEGINSTYVDKAIKMLEDSGTITEAKKKGIDFINNSLEGYKGLAGKDNKAVLKISTLFNDMIPKGI